MKFKRSVPAVTDISSNMTPEEINSLQGVIDFLDYLNQLSNSNKIMIDVLDNELTTKMLSTILCAVSMEGVNSKSLFAALTYAFVTGYLSTYEDSETLEDIKNIISTVETPNKVIAAFMKYVKSHTEIYDEKKIKKFGDFLDTLETSNDKN